MSDLAARQAPGELSNLKKLKSRKTYTVDFCSVLFSKLAAKLSSVGPDFCREKPLYNNIGGKSVKQSLVVGYYNIRVFGNLILNFRSWKTANLGAVANSDV